jgi:hypothetical protein
MLLEGAFRERGTYAVPCDGADFCGLPVAPGVYFVRLEACPTAAARVLSALVPES